MSKPPSEEPFKDPSRRFTNFFTNSSRIGNVVGSFLRPNKGSNAPRAMAAAFPPNNRNSGLIEHGLIKKTPFSNIPKFEMTPLRKEEINAQRKKYADNHKKYNKWYAEAAKRWAHEHFEMTPFRKELINMRKFILNY